MSTSAYDTKWGPGHVLRGMAAALGVAATETARFGDALERLPDPVPTRRRRRSGGVNIRRPTKPTYYKRRARAKGKAQRAARRANRAA